jgi:hypothetical protein
MTCPECNGKLKCIETRAHDNYTRRRYKCPNCDKRWSTQERFNDVQIEQPAPVVEHPIPVVTKPKPLLKSIHKVSYAEARWRLTHPGQPYPGDKEN